MALPIGGTKLNVEAFNKKREKDVADAGGKLLSLAIELKRIWSDSQLHMFPQ